MKRRKVKSILAWMLIWVMMQNNVYADGWLLENQDWGYEQNGVKQSGWINDGSGWYHLDESKKLHTGWFKEEQSWYFLNTLHDGYFGRALTNQWAWIDGYCYLFDADGKMYANCITPDGYEVDANGRWTVNGAVQYEEGKGIITTNATVDGQKGSGGGSRRSGGSGGGGGGGGSSSGGGGSSGGGNGGSSEEDKKPGGDDSEGDKKPGGDDSEGDKKPGGDDSEGDKKPGMDDSEDDKKPGGDDSEGDKKPGGDDSEGDKKPGGDDTPDNPKEDVPFAEGIEFAEGVKTAAIEYTANEEASTITVSNSEEVSGWKAGDIYILQDGAVPGNDIAVKITSIEHSGNGTIIHYEQPELEDLVDSINISGSEEIVAEFIPEEGVEVMPMGRMSMRSSESGTINPSKTFSIEVEKNGIGVSGTLCLDRIHYKYIAGKNAEGRLEVEQCRFVVDSSFTESVGIFKKPEKPVKIPLGVVHIPISGPLTATVEVAIVFNAEGNIQVTLIAENNELGFDYSKRDGLKPVCHMQPRLANAVLEGSVGLLLSVPITAKLFGFDLVEVGGEAGVEVNGNLETISFVPSMFCFDAKIYRVATLYAQLTAGDEDSRLEWNIWDSNNEDCLIDELHIEETGVVPSCTRGTGKCSGYVKDSGSDPVPNATVHIMKDETIVGKASTDETGYYIISSLRPGIYQVRISAEGFRTIERSVQIRNDEESTLNGTLSVSAGGTKEDVCLSGYVMRSSDHSPIPYAHVQVYSDGALIKDLDTDENGYFDIFWREEEPEPDTPMVQPGRYSLHVTAGDYHSYSTPMRLYNGINKVMNVYLFEDTKDLVTLSGLIRDGSDHDYITGHRYMRYVHVYVKSLEEGNPIVAEGYGRKEPGFGIEIPPGMYLIEADAGSESGFLPYSAYLHITENIDNYDIYLFPKEAADFDHIMEVELSWDSEPQDLDAHIAAYGGAIYYAHKNDHGFMLDQDVFTGHGPETIRIYKDKYGNTSKYYVHDYTNRKSTDSNALSQSGATVKIYYDGKLLKTIRVPAGKKGTLWHVFDYSIPTEDEESVKIDVVNEFTYEEFPNNITIDYDALHPREELKLYELEGQVTLLSDGEEDLPVQDECGYLNEKNTEDEERKENKERDDDAKEGSDINEGGTESASSSNAERRQKPAGSDANCGDSDVNSREPEDTDSHSDFDKAGSHERKAGISQLEAAAVKEAENDDTSENSAKKDDLKDHEE